MGKLTLILLFLFVLVSDLDSQLLSQILKGTVTDKESRMPLAGANVVILNTTPPTGTSTDSVGKFRLSSEVGRISIKVSFLGYEDLFLSNILIASGKEVSITINMQEKVIQTSDAIVHSDKSGSKSLNQMATISTNTIRTDDALRYAGGFYDPSRIVNAFAGVITSNSDVSNDIVIRGNSSRGLLWRLEGIEIPNPNHFSDGQGGSGGAFSAITSNVIDNFDFFTGAFPAEFGNAVSGVMDLNLRKGNSDKHEYAFQTGMIGAEISMEGPFSGKSDASFLVNARYTNFKILSDLKIIELGETNYAPRTKDLAFNINTPLKKAGNLNLFGVMGASEIGNNAVRDFTTWNSTSDLWEYRENQSFGTVGIKHLFILPNSKTFIKTVVAYSSFSSSYSEGYVDSSYIRTNSYFNDYNFRTTRTSLLVNHKLNSKNTFRGGVNYSFLRGFMENFNQLSSGLKDTLVGPSGRNRLFQSYLQWKHRTSDKLEINTGFHIIESDLNGHVNIEPRFGLRWEAAPGNSFILGFGLHSRTESLAVYNALVKNGTGVRSAFNKELDLSKALHWVAGFDFTVTENVRLHIEGYLQYLYNVPIVNKITSQYSTLNSAEHLPDAVLENAGSGMNKGIEITLERSFTKNYYFLLTGSLFDSWYKAGDNRQYNTYYNTRYVTNFLFGKDFLIGKNKKNSIGINTKYVLRGGYRYTPPDVYRSLKSKRIIFNNSSSYIKQLPEFMRLDAGINFRRNKPSYSWIIMLDLQNATNRKNVFRRRFSYETGKIVSNDILSLGIVPVINFRLEF